MNALARLALTGAASGTLLLLAACGSNKTAPDTMQSDVPAGALGDEIVVDPGATQAEARAGNPVALTPQQRSPEAIAAARDAAMLQAGGTLKSAPQPQSGGASALVGSAASSAQVSQAAKAASTDCAKKAQVSADWTGKLPKDLPVYPRGAVQEAAGTDADGCHLRVVNFVTPVTPRDVMDFYFTKTTGAGYGAEYRMDGSDHVLGGRKGGQAYLVYARKQANGLTEVDLISSGQ